MADDALEKEHLPTAKRLTQLRTEGQALRAKDFSSGLIFVIGIISLMLMSNSIYGSLKLVFNNIVNVISNIMWADQNLLAVINFNFMIILKVLLPFFLLTVGTALLAPMLFGGWNFTLQPLMFKFNFLNPIPNIGRMFSAQIFSNIGKSVVKFFIIFSLFLMYLWAKKILFFSLTNKRVDSLMMEISNLFKSYLGTICVAIVIIVAMDIALSIYSFNKKNKMSSQELKDEFKEAEGSVDVKRKMRAMQIQLLKQRLSTLVPQARVIVTNPTHYAIAIGYDETKDRAPKVLAKGKDLLAKQIREIAVRHAVPIYEAPPLARAIYHTTKIGAPIDPALYMAVAIIFSYLQQLQQYQIGNAPFPQYISDLKIPAELNFDS